MLRTFILAGFVATTALADDNQRKPVVLTDEGRAVHSSGFLFDGHNDLPWQMRQIGSSSFDVFDISKPQPKLHTYSDRL